MTFNGLYYEILESIEPSKDLKILINNIKKHGYKLGFFNGNIKKETSRFTLQRALANGVWVSDDYETALQYSKFGGVTDGVVHKVAIRYDNPLDLRPLGIQTDVKTIKTFLEQKGVHLPDLYYTAFANEAINEEQDEWFTYAIIDGNDWKTDRKLAIATIMKAGYDCLLLGDTHYGVQSDSYVIFDIRNVKLDTLKTFDDSGNVIDSRLRFDPTNPDVRY